jgi:hypothetical protein
MANEIRYAGGYSYGRSVSVEAWHTDYATIRTQLQKIAGYEAGKRVRVELPLAAMYEWIIPGQQVSFSDPDYLEAISKTMVVREIRLSGRDRVEIVGEEI